LDCGGLEGESVDQVEDVHLILQHAVCAALRTLRRPAPAQLHPAQLEEETRALLS